MALSVVTTTELLQGIAQADLERIVHLMREGEAFILHGSRLAQLTREEEGRSEVDS